MPGKGLFLKERIYAKPRAVISSYNKNAKHKHKGTKGGAMKLAKSNLHVRVSQVGIYGPTFHSTKVINKKVSKKVREMMNLGSKNQYVTNAPALCENGKGSQFIADYVIGGKADLRAMATAMTINGNTTTDNTPTNTDQWVYERSVTSWEMTNQSDLQAIVEIYYYKCLKDTGSNVSTLWGTSLLNEQTAGTSVQISTPNQTPLTHPGVNQFWKCHKVVHMSMNPGQMHKETFDYHPNKVVNNSLVYGSAGAQSNTYIGGISEEVLFVIRGVPVVDTGTGNAAIGQTQIAIMNYENHYATYIQDLNYNLSSTVAFTSGALKTYNQGSGAVELNTVVA